MYTYMFLYLSFQGLRSTYDVLATSITLDDVAVMLYSFTPYHFELCLSRPSFLESALAREPLFEPCLASNEFHSGPPGPDST